MKKRALALLLSAALLTGLYGCSTAGTGSEEPSAAVSEEAFTAETADNQEAETAAETEDAEELSADTDYTTGTPWMDSNIEANVAATGDVDLKDHFDLAVNGNWVKENPIKSGNYENAYLLSFEDTLHERLLDIMQEDSAEDHNATLVHTLYSEFLDWDARAAAGTEPLMPYLQDIEEIQDISDLEAYITKADYKFSDVLMFGPIASPQDASRKILYISSPEFFLDDAADYEDLENMSDYTRQSYDSGKEMVEIVLLQCGYTQEQIDRIYEDTIWLEQQMAQYCYSNEEHTLTRTSEKLAEQIYTPEELEQYHWFFLLKQAATAYGLKTIPGMWLYEKIDFFEHLDEIISDSNLECIKNYLLAHTAASAMSLLDKETYYKRIDIQNSRVGSTGYMEESEYAVNTVSSMLQWPLAKLYCDQYVSEEDKQNVYDLIEETISGYKEMLQKEEFLSEATREKAIEKLDKMRIKCMYPDDWSEYMYDGLELPDRYFDTVVAISEYETQKMLSTFYDPVNKDKWDSCTPITQNAFYDSQTNSINILPGLIGDVLYSSDMPKEEVYGKLGVVIGHEISHAFDPDGAAYDADGNRNSWWTEEDQEKFKEKTDKMVAYYDAITVWDDMSCSGEQNKGEACADMGGMAVMLHLAAEDPDFDYALFFKSFARVWAQNTTPEYVYYCANYDEHPLGYLRTNVTVAQFEEFYETFGIEEGDGMYIAPEDRVKIW